mmetsp:Transcript_88828/g.215415  ORF Transcript_88828/g.215415 Transcript_88828/m.215415 type:complete len:97 (+) Transcript_88828:1-291(+)
MGIRGWPAGAKRGDRTGTLACGATAPPLRGETMTLLWFDRGRARELVQLPSLDKADILRELPDRCIWTCCRARFDFDRKSSVVQQGLETIGEPSRV